MARKRKAWKKSYFTNKQEVVDLISTTDVRTFISTHLKMGSSFIIIAEDGEMTHLNFISTDDAST